MSTTHIHVSRTPSGTTYSHVSAPTQVVEAGGVRYAYRHFWHRDRYSVGIRAAFSRGNGPLGPTGRRRYRHHRPVILFDNAGLASSSGETPDTFDAQAEQVARVIGGPLIGASSPIAAGAAAPAFALAGASDRKIALSDFVGKTVILVFYPADWSPVCTDQLALYNELLPLFTEHRAQVLGISVDGVWSHRAFARDRNLRFPLLSDFEPKGAVSRAYGVYSEQDGTSERALFVIDGAGVVRWSFVSPSGVNPGADGILRALEALAGPAVAS